MESGSSFAVSGSDLGASVKNGNGVNGKQNKSSGKVGDLKTSTSKEIYLQTMTVVKRNGMLVPFRPERINKAVESAFRDIKEISITTPLPQEIYSAVQEVAHEVVQAAKEQAQHGESLTVEGIQDLVEQKLMECGHYEVARGYIVYREERKAIRDDSPRNLKVTRRDGATVVRFNPMKIASAIERAMRASLKIEGPSSQEIIDSVNLITNKVVTACARIAKEGGDIHVELIQDEIEKQMMMEGYFQIAKDFIIYRATRAALRAVSYTHLTLPTKRIV